MISFSNLWNVDFDLNSDEPSLKRNVNKTKPNKKCNKRICWESV